MFNLRFWLAFFAAAGVPLIFYLTQRQQSQGRLQEWRETATERATGVAEAARETLGSVVGTAGRRAADAGGTAREQVTTAGETARGTAGSVAGTAAQVAGRAGAALAAAPRLVARRRGGAEDQGAYTENGEDWRDYGNELAR